MNVPTRPSLIAMLGDPANPSAWEMFYAQYASLVIGFARDRGIDAEGARDVLQETMIVVMRKLPTFEYDPSRGRFSNWLLTIVSRKISEARRRRRTEPHLSLDESATEDVVAMDELVAQEDHPDADLERAWRLKLLEEAIQRVLSDPHTRPESVAVFRACALEGEPAADVAARFRLKPNAVYQIKNRLFARVQSLLEDLEEGMSMDTHADEDTP